ncbi:methyl-CpG-binding domain-containing protein [Salix suchowensis]|nr:methyl-CpG-binding domain-containing protein [Salix suchowensis]
MGDPKSDDWLPEGWRVEVKVRNNGKKDKFYFPPSGGCRFNSKIEVSRYLNGSHPNSEQKERSNDRRHSNEVVIEKTVPEGLPMGWTKEIKLTKKGGRIRRDLSPAVSEQQGLEIHKKQNPVIGDQSLKSWEIAKDDQILTSISSGECIAGYGRTSDQCMSAAKRQNVEVDGIQSSIVSDQSPKSFKIAKDGQSLNSASAGECTTISEHASDQYISIAKKQKLEVSGTSSQIVSDQTLKSCEIARDEQLLDSASKGECTAVSKHTSDQFVSVIMKQKLAVNRTPISTISDQSLKSFEIAKDEQMLNSASAGECTVIFKHTSGGVGTESSSSEFPEDKSSNQTEEKSGSVKAEDPLQAVLQDKPSVEVGETKMESKKTGVRKSRKKTDLNLPRRASKRLAGIPLAPTPELKATTRARRAALEPSNGIIASTSEQASCGDPDTDLNIKHAFDTSKSTEILVDSYESKHDNVDVEHAGKEGSGKERDKKRQCDVASPPGNLATGEHAGKIETSNTGDEKQGLPFDLPLEELWQDPCIAFAIKTLTGTSVDDSDSIKVSSGSSNNEFVGMATLDNHAGKEGSVNNGNLFIPEEHARAVGTSNKADEKSVSPLVLPFADAWSDPCIEFAIKTLTGALPLDFDMVQDYLPLQASSSPQQESSGFTLPNVGEFCQTEFLCQQFGTSEKPSFNQAGLVGPTFPHTKHVNLGYASAAGPSRCLHSEERSFNRRR